MGMETCVCYVCGTQFERKAQGRPIVKHFCSMKCKAEYQTWARPISKELLYEYYIVQKLDCTQIGKMVNRDSKSVWNWLKYDGVPTRPRGSNVDQLPRGRIPGFTMSEEAKDKMRQIAISQHRVPYDPKIGSYMKGRKGQDTPNWKGGITPERQAFYESREWLEAVKEVWRRDNAICQRCGKRHNETLNRGTFHIHHIESFMNKNKRALIGNLVLLCADCHRWVHSKKNKDKEWIKGE